MKRRSKISSFHPSAAISPLRYPGGKSWLIPTVERWLNYLETTKRNTFVEPFAGGANVGITMLERGKVGNLVLGEIDPEVSSLWKLILGDPDWLIAEIALFKPSKKNLIARLERKYRLNDFRERGFQTLLRNRTTRGGVLSSTGGFLKRGERNNGVFSRWYPITLISRIVRIKRLRDNIRFVQGDGIKLINNRRHRTSDVFLIDPPYSFSQDSAGRRLYAHYELEHTKLFTLSRALCGNFLMTYDRDKSIFDLARNKRLKIELVAMKNSHNAILKEALISTDLSWLNQRGKQ